MSFLSIAIVLDQTNTLLCESHCKHAHNVVACGLGIDMRFNECLPFLDQGTQAATRDRHTIEVSRAVAFLNLSNAKLCFLVGTVTIILQVCQIQFQHTVLQLLAGNFGPRGFSHKGFTAILRSEHAWCFGVVPFFNQKWISSLLLVSFLATLGQSCFVAVLLL